MKIKTHVINFRIKAIMKQSNCIHFQIVTNGQYKSIEHRATVNSEKERLSIATFFNPNVDAIIGPAPSLITPETPPKFTRVIFDKFFKNLFSRELNRKTNLEQYSI